MSNQEEREQRDIVLGSFSTFYVDDSFAVDYQHFLLISQWETKAMTLTNAQAVEYLSRDPLYGEGRRSTFSALCQIRAVAQAGILSAEEAEDRPWFNTQDLFSAILFLADGAEELRHSEEEDLREAKRALEKATEAASGKNP